MPGRDFGPGLHGGPGGFGLSLVFMGLSMLLWLALPALAVWAALRWIAPRMRGPLAQGMGTPVSMAQPSAIETLRHRYALGEIDAPTFEQMVERILASEAWERQRGDMPPEGGETPPIYHS